MGKKNSKKDNPKWINDDYVKFIRLGQYLIEKNKAGILAFVTNHGFLDNPTFRGMRWHLLQAFDSIYILDLHGNAKKKEKSPDGSVDKNVFDIQQGVSIALFVKTGKKKKEDLASVHHFDLYGTREKKYNDLKEHDLGQIPFQTLSPVPHKYFFVQKDLGAQKEYEKGLILTELFALYGVGITTAR